MFVQVAVSGSLKREQRKAEETKSTMSKKLVISIRNEISKKQYYPTPDFNFKKKTQEIL